MSDHLRLTTTLERLDGSSFHLQSNITNFVQQIKTKVRECVDNNPDSNKALKDAIDLVTTADSTILEYTDMFTESTQLYPPSVMKGEKTTSESKIECYADISRRLKDIETALSSLQETQKKTEDDISEIKQWRDNFVTEQSDLGIKIEKLSNMQKQNVKSITKQIHEQDKKIEKLFEKIESLKEKASFSDKITEQMSIDYKEYKSYLDKIQKEMTGLTDKMGHLSQEIRSQSDLISTIQEDGKKNRRYTIKLYEKLLTKYAVICKLLQQRMIPIDKMIERSDTRERNLKKIKTQKTSDFKPSHHSPTIANQQNDHCTPGFIVLQGRLKDKEDNKEEDIIAFKSVKRNVGKHFDKKSGVFTVPVDGLYRASLTIIQRGNSAVNASVGRISGGVPSYLGYVETKNKSVEASDTFQLQLKTGDMFFLVTMYKDCECTHFSCSLI